MPLGICIPVSTLKGGGKMPLSGKEQQRAIREIEESRKRGLYSSHTEETPQGNNWIGVFLVIVGLLMMGCAALMVLQLIK